MDYRIVLEIISISGLILNIIGITKIYIDVCDRLTKIETLFDSHIKVSDKEITEIFRRLDIVEGRN